MCIIILLALAKVERIVYMKPLECYFLVRKGWVHALYKASCGRLCGCFFISFLFLSRGFE